ncbi:MAG: hypothetical protein P8Y52_14685 [Xanthomonadales bacterium]
MGILTLVLGLSLPWLNGAAWMGAVQWRFGAGAAGEQSRIWGYGFFLGYAFLGLLLLVQARLTGGVNWSVPMAVLAATTLIGAWLAMRFRRPEAVTGENAAGGFRSLSLGGKFLLVMLASWAVLHLARALLDELAIPVYPWDAWLLWVYRAKAWFFAGNIFDFYSAAEWLNLSDPNAYTVDAVHYPRLPSLFPLWAALSYGQWSETLIALPTFLCGIAIGLALYGQCLRAGSGVLLAVIAVYALYSVPLIGTHLALAGYADIWMTGFAGLGFTAWGSWR